MVHAVVEKLRAIDVPTADVTYGRLSDLAERLEIKEGYAGEHTAAVSRLSVEIAEKLGLAADECRMVELGALLHDVGKVSIPDRILTKQGALTELEWAVMQRHAATGERLLVRILDLPDVLAIVRSHHERWDGAGYPDGTRGNEIPIAARIVAVADAYRAMIEPRPYRLPRTPADALREMLAQSGRQFDPACVEALRAIVERQETERAGLK